MRDDSLRSAWSDIISAGAIGSCHPQRAEFRRSARNTDEYEQMTGMFTALFPDVGMPKNGWRWVDSAQYRLLRTGAHRAMSAIDLLICATAVFRGLIVLHDDNDFATAARHLTDLAERQVHDTPGHESPA